MFAGSQRKGPLGQRSSSPWIVLFAALMLTVGLTALLDLVIRRKEQTRFDTAVQTAQDRIQNRMDSYLALLAGVSGFFSAQEAAGQQVTARQFRTYLQRIEVPRHYPGVQGIGFSRRFPCSDRDALLAAMRREIPSFHVWPERLSRECNTIVYLEPLDRRNLAALGYDMSTEPVRAAAMALARDMALPATSGKVTLVQEIDADRQAGFLIFVPVYRGERLPAAGDRRSALLGFVYSAFRAGDLWSGLFGSEVPSHVAFEVYDGMVATPEHLLYRSGMTPDSASHAPRHGRSMQLTVAGRPWTLLFSSVPAFDADSGRLLSNVAGLAGVLVSLVLFAVTRLQAKAREQAELSAADLARSEEALRESEAQLHGLVEQLAEESRSHATLRRIAESFAKDLDQQRLLQRITDEATELTEAQFGAFFHNQATEQGPAFLLHALSGTSREAFGDLQMPRVTDLFLPTLRGEAIIRLDDVTQDGRYGRNGPHGGVPPGHVPVRSYLAVPVIAGSGEVLGGLFFGHREPGMFSAVHEQVMMGVAAQAAVALDNARLYREARQAIQVRDEFLSIASHELKTPVTSLHLYLESTLRQVQQSWDGPGHKGKLERLEARLAAADRQTQHLTLLIDQLLDVSRITAGRLEFDLEEMDLCALVRDVAERFEQEAGRCGCTLYLSLDASVMGRWDRPRLDQVVTNLLSNALKYGKGKPVEVAVQDQDGRAQLLVRDQGIGIAAEDQARLFGRFERLVSSRHFGGFGLGLWICRQIVEALGGAITVSSAVDQGSTFIMSLPYSRA